MRVDLDLLADRQLVVVIRLKTTTRRRAAQDLHRVLASRSSSAQRLARAREPRLHRADRDAERIGDLLVAQTVDFPQHDGRPLVERQRVERRLQPGRELLLGEHTVGPGFGARPELAVGRRRARRATPGRRGGAGARSDDGCGPG